MPSNPFTTQLFSGGDGSPKAPEALYNKTIGLFPEGSYRSNPLSDPTSDGSGLGNWWTATWTALKSALPPRKQLPQDAQRIDTNWVDKKVGEITDAINGLELARNAKDRRGYADLVLQKLGEIQGELPLNELAAVPVLETTAEALRDAGFTVAKGVVARALNADRPGETVQDTYRQLELTDTAATHWWLGGDVPDGIEISKGELAAAYFATTSEDFHAPEPAGGAGNVVERFATLLSGYGTAQNAVNGLSATRNRTTQQDSQLAQARQDMAKAVDDIANLTRKFADHTGELAAKDAKSDDVVQSTVTAMLFAESMRSLTNVTRPGAQPGAVDRLTPAQTKDLIGAATEAAGELPDKFKERAAPEETGWGV